MVDLTVADPLMHALESKQIECEKRPYLGMSSLAGICNREKWYTFRWAYTQFITPRMDRLFKRGHREEAIVIEDLKKVGVICKNVLDDQIELVGVMGHCKGHPDGDLENVPGAEKTSYNFECKTANTKHFKEFVKFGVKETREQYYGQSQLYMRYKGQERTLFIVVNKETDERYIERIRYDPAYTDELEDIAIDILSSPLPPVKISERPEWYECKWCNAYSVCHGGVQVDRNCRTCKNVRIRDKGEWTCEIYPGKPIPEDFQRVGCRDHYRPIV